MALFALPSLHENFGVAVLEVAFDGTRPNGTHVTSAPISFPESASPHAASPALPTLPQSAGLSVRLDSSRGGSLCAGERSQLWLESDRDAFITARHLAREEGILAGG